MAIPDQRRERDPPPLEATPFEWRDLRLIPERAFLYGQHHVRGSVSATVGPGGVGKSKLMIVEALAMASGRTLLIDQPRTTLRVWYWNGEDPLEELERRVRAASQYYNISAEDLGGRLFVNSGRECKIALANETSARFQIHADAFKALSRTLQNHRIDLLILDPFIALHAVSENNNTHIASILRGLAGVATEANCGVEVVHHVRKGDANRELTVEDGRGASAFKDAVRSVRVLNSLPSKEVRSQNLDPRFSYFRVATGKANLRPVGGGRSLRMIISVHLGNGPGGSDGDSVGVVALTAPEVPVVSPATVRKIQEIVCVNEYRLNWQAQDWIGRVIGKVIGLDPAEPADRRKIERMINKWVETGALKIVQRRDTKKRDQRKFIEVGEWVDNSAAPPPNNDGEAG
jgi:hypothetical protein